MGEPASRERLQFSVQDAALPSSDLADAVDALRLSREVTNNVRYRGAVRELPSRAALRPIVDGLIAALFPTHYGRPDLSDQNIDYFVGHTLDVALSALTVEIRRGLSFRPDLEGTDIAATAIDITRAFTQQLADIRALIVSDLLAAYEGDPAATSASEILLSYPGIRATIHYRLAHALYRLGAYFVAKLISAIAHAETGVDIHPGARIAKAFFIDHGTGVVIGETTVIGSDVRLYQAVTLGARSFPVDENGNLIKGSARHPLIEDDVVIYAGATILGRITVGRGSTIGGNVWLTQSVPPGSIVTQAQTRRAPHHPQEGLGVSKLAPVADEADRAPFDLHLSGR
jgi:serine O-acetyltransferase